MPENGEGTFNASSHIVQEAVEGAVGNTVLAAGSVALEDIKAIGGGLAFYANLAAGNAVANQQQLNSLGAAAIAKAQQMILETEVSEAAGSILLASLLTQPAQKPSVVTPSP